ncbi:DUF424 family protein [Candidatus Woesearchaeota archaeon]|nr:DUF424 family protein [Candidatus Woesearchaeota archaeon]
MRCVRSKTSCKIIYIIKIYARLLSHTMMIVKIHKCPDGRKVIAVCDPDVLGKKFEKGELQLDLTTDFYKGEEKDKDELLAEIRKGSCNVNIAGKKSVAFFVESKIIEEDNIIEVDGVPHAQAVIIMDD